jgi:hypothetical protein
MSQSTVVSGLSSAVSARESVAAIPAKWLPWSRALWIFIALTSIVTFGGLLYLTRQFSDQLPPRIADGLSQLGWTNDGYFWFHATFMALSFVCYFAIGTFIYLVRPNDRMAWFASILLIAFGGEIAYPLTAEFIGKFTTAPLFFRAPYLVNNLFSWGFLGAFLALFPDGRFVPRWSRFVALFGFCFSFGFSIFPSQFGAPEGPFFAVVMAGALFLFGGSLYAQIWRYRHYSTRLQKQQTKWLIYGLALIVGFVFVITTAIYLFLPTQQVTPATYLLADLAYFLANLTFLFLPLSIGIAIVRYRLWDIDIIIRKTVTYTIVVALLLIVYFSIVILLQQIFATVTGLGGNEIITVISTLAIAALFVPLRNKIQDVIDKRFYRKKYDAQQVLQKFAETVRDETDIDKLTTELVNVVQETMQPKSVSVWLKADDGRQTTGNRQHATDDGG